MPQTLNINCCKESLISKEGEIYQAITSSQSILLTLESPTVWSSGYTHL